jgi:hypothetical protein
MDRAFIWSHAAPRDPLYEYLAGNADESIWRTAVAFSLNVKNGFS